MQKAGVGKHIPPRENFMNTEVRVKRELRAMHKAGYRVRRVLIQFLEERTKKKFVLRLKPKDQLRLGIFEVWAARHKVSVGYVLQTILDYWRAKRKGSLLGASLPALTSGGSYALLVNKIAEDFPDGANVSLWKAQERMRLLGLAEPRGKIKSLFDPENAEHSCSIEIEHIERRRKVLEKAESESWRKQRRWRGNPWV
jgi:hypothetical protein